MHTHTWAHVDLKTHTYTQMRRHPGTHRSNRRIHKHNHLRGHSKPIWMDADALILANVCRRMHSTEKYNVLMQIMRAICIQAGRQIARVGRIARANTYACRRAMHTDGHQPHTDIHARMSAHRPTQTLIDACGNTEHRQTHTSTQVRTDMGKHRRMKQ